jgi:lactate dehydrogenase-like 2-hydroxyacid dehydrogenase
MQIGQQSFQGDVAKQEQGGVLLLISMQKEFLVDLQKNYRMQQLQTTAAINQLAPEVLAATEVVVTNGSTGLLSAQMDMLPNLKLICSYGAGYENIDLLGAKQRGVAVTHAPGVNNATVADHAMALMLGISRGLPELDRAVKEGAWLQNRKPRPTVNGKRLGILGMGNIGVLIAKRAAAFDMQVAYHSRRKRQDLGYLYMDSLAELATKSDYLILACPGGVLTRHIVSKQILELLGPDGYLINIARGSVVDTQALILALREHRIAGAAIDVIENEPELPADIESLNNLIITPHISGRSPEAQLAQHRTLQENLSAYFAGTTLSNQLGLDL